jgi:hypothetical protein
MSTQSTDTAARSRVEDTVIRMFVATDERDWPLVASCFTDPFVLDMSSLGAGAAAATSPAQVTAAWAAAFEPLTHVHHQVGNFQTQLAGERAQVRCYGIAFHHRADLAIASRSRTFVGSYDFELTRQDAQWRIAVLRFKLKFIEGNLELEKAR